jgi:hypothetical protein
LKDWASADVPALSSSAHSSPVAECDQAEDRQLAGHQHFRNDLLVFASFASNA